MKEKDYNKWLEAKSEFEDFDEIPETLKKCIYKAEQELEGNEEVELYEISPEERIIVFKWTGFDKELERVADEMGYENPEDAEDIVNGAGHDMMLTILKTFNELAYNPKSPSNDCWKFYIY